MNDIEILEKLVIYWNSLINYAGSDKTSVVYKWINTEGVVEKRDALQNLINRVKELEDENNDLHEEIDERIKLKIENEKIVDNEFISKDKIKEKIEEVKNSKENYTFAKLTSEDIRRTIITNLQELLEEQEDK